MHGQNNIKFKLLLLLSSTARKLNEAAVSLSSRLCGWKCATDYRGILTTERHSVVE